jgi:lipopolysaccharide export system protein LptC
VRLRRSGPRVGGGYDLFVKVMKEALPAMSLALLGTLVIWPLANTREFSFLVSKDRVESSAERMRMEQPVYRGTDSNGRAFEIKADRAVQRSSEDPTVELINIAARLDTADGQIAVTAAKGSFNLPSQQLTVSGPVDLGRTDGTRITTGDALVDLRSRTVRSLSPIGGTGPLGRFQADRFQVDLKGTSATLQGNVRMRITPSRG